MNEDLIKRLQALARSEHDDHSVGEEAAEEIRRLEEDLAVNARLLAKQSDMARDAEVISSQTLRKLRRARDFFKFVANSEGGLVAEIDDFLGDEKKFETV